MQTLLRKEIRERAMWVLALCIATVAATCTHGYTFCGSASVEMLTWSVGPALIACLFGTSSYTSELAADRAAFLLTRPVSWKRIVLAKVVVGLGALAAASVVAAVAYRLSCPEPYLPFAGGQHLLFGAAYSFALMCVGFAVGLGCSTVLPGFAGGPLALLVLSSLCFVLFSGIRNYFGGWPWTPMQFLWPLASLGGAIAIARFGLTLSPTARLRRFSASTFCGLIILALLLYFVPQKYVSGARHGLSSEIITWSISPDGKYAVGRNIRNTYWLDVSSNVLTVSENVYDEGSFSRDATCWRPPHTAFRIAFGKDDWSIRMYRPDSEGVAVENVQLSNLLDARLGHPFAMTASPDGRLAAIKLSVGIDLPQTVIFFDTVTRKLLPHHIVFPAKSSVWWWQSSRELGYLDANGKPNVFRLTE